MPCEALQRPVECADRCLLQVDEEARLVVAGAVAVLLADNPEAGHTVGVVDNVTGIVDTVEAVHLLCAAGSDTCELTVLACRICRFSGRVSGFDRDTLILELIDEPTALARRFFVGDHCGLRVAVLAQIEELDGDDGFASDMHSPMPMCCFYRADRLVHHPVYDIFNGHYPEPDFLLADCLADVSMRRQVDKIHFVFGGGKKLLRCHESERGGIRAAIGSGPEIPNF